MEFDARIGARIRACRGNAGARSAARLRHQLGSGDSARQQDRIGPDRMRDCRRGRYRERSARGLSEKFSAADAAQLPRQDLAPPSWTLAWIAHEGPPAGAAGNRGTPYRPVDGRKYGAHGEDL